MSLADYLKHKNRFMSGYQGEIYWCRDFRLNALPRDKAGNVLYAGNDQEAYVCYVDWLADYLFQAQIPPDGKQITICRAVEQMTPKYAVMMIGENAAFYDWDVETVKYYPYEDEEPDFLHEITDEDIQRIKDEQWQLKQLCPEASEDFCDMAWRIPLSVILKRVPDKSERIELLRLFFAIYVEYSNK